MWNLSHDRAHAGNWQVQKLNLKLLLFFFFGPNIKILLQNITKLTAFFNRIIRSVKLGSGVKKFAIQYKRNSLLKNENCRNLLHLLHHVILKNVSTVVHTIKLRGVQNNILWLKKKIGHFSKSVPLCSTEESKWSQNFHFQLNYPINVSPKSKEQSLENIYMHYKSFMIIFAHNLSLFIHKGTIW